MRETADRSSLLRGPGGAALLAYAAAVLLVTLFPVRNPVPVSCTTIVVCGSRGVADIILNVALFVPLGAVLRLTGVTATWWAAGIVAALTSLGIEFAQFAVPGRHPSAGDVLFNGAGGALGYATAVGLTAFLTHPRRWARRWGPVWSVVATGILAATGALLVPAFDDAPLYGQWTPDLGQFEQYDGTVLRARIGRHDVDDGRHPASAQVYAALRGGAPVEVDFVAATPPAALAPVFSVFDAGQSEVLVLGVRGRTLVFRVANRASRLRLSTPDLRFPVPTGTSPGDTVRLRLTRAGGSTTMEIDDRETAWDAFTLGRGWGILLYPDGLGPVPKALMDVFWLACLVLPLGFFTRAAGTHPALAAAWPAPVIVLLALAPWFFPVAATPLTQWGAAGAGLLAGALLAPGTGRRGAPAVG